MTFEALLSFLGARPKSSVAGGFQLWGVVGFVVCGVGWTEPSRRVGKVTTLTLGRFGGAGFRCDLLVGDCLDGDCLDDDRLLGERLVGD